MSVLRGVPAPGAQRSIAGEIVDPFSSHQRAALKAVSDSFLNQSLSIADVTGADYTHLTQ